jgi:hypothetical protein
VLATAEEQRAGAGHHHVVLRHDRIDQSKSTAIAHDRGMHVHGLLRDRPEQIDRQTGGLKVVVDDFPFCGSPEQPADVVACQR